jgi:hypothetical protein
MNCQIFENVVNDLAREQMIEADAREQALAHSGDCDACALRLSLEIRLTSGLRALAAEMKSASASTRVEEELIRAFRAQSSSLSQTRPTNWSRYWAVAAAAVVLIAFAIAGLKWGLEGTTRTAVTNDHPSTPAPSSSPAVVIDDKDREPAPRQSPSVYRLRPRPTLARSGKRFSRGNEMDVGKAGLEGAENLSTDNARQSEVTTQFLPLSYASSVSLQDGGQLVRVELPRSAMVSLGLPVNMERYGEKVKADVLVSADGLARAIRFVQ